MNPVIWRVVALLFAGASAFRVRPTRKSQSTPGQIAGLFAYAAPGSAQPGLQNPRGGPCFPGLRTATVQMQWFGQEADLATTVTGVLGFRHPKMPFKMLDLKTKSNNKLYNCEDDSQDRPRGLPKPSLHGWELYKAAIEGYSGLLFNVSNMALKESYNLDRYSADKNVRAFGWRVIGSAVDPGGANKYVGKQVSHLIQHPETKACMLTFQGSSSAGDWAANLNVKKIPFCGYAPAGSFIADNDTSSVLAAGQSLVHKGFRDALMQIVQNADWQKDVRPKLSSCSKVYVAGHSLGGAQAELFAACAQMAPQRGKDGYEEDYKYIGWTQGR